MSSSSNEIRPIEARALGIYFTRTVNDKTTVINPTAQITDSSSSTTFGVSNVTILAILGTIGLYASGQLEHLGSFLCKLVLGSGSKSLSMETPTELDAQDDPQMTQFAVILGNLGCKSVDVSKAIDKLKGLDWKDANGKLTANISLGSTLTSGQLLTLLTFRTERLPQDKVDYLTRKTLLVLDQKYGVVDGPTTKFLQAFNATSVGDLTGSGGDDPQSEAWAKGLFNRLTTGGPNGSMAGKIAVNFMNTVQVAAAFDFKPKASTTTFDEPATNPLVAILKDAVVSAAESAAQGLADYLKTLRKPSTGSDTTDADRQSATVVKGIKDSMPSTGKTVAQLAVFNALGNPEMAKLPRAQQLRVAYTVANSARAAVESTGNHIADLYQSNSIPLEEELAAVGARGLLDFLKSVGTTVANGVMQAAPVVLNAVLNSSNANNALGSTLPPEVSLSCSGLHELDTPTKIILASRIVNGVPNADATVVTDKAVSELADRQSNLSAQATLDTFSHDTIPSALRDDPPQELRDKFRQVALEVAGISPTFSNVTDIGATNLVTDSALKHSDALRQHTLEMGIRSSANMIAEHKSAEILYKVHLYRLNNGTEVKPRGFTDFLKTAVPIAANIAKVAAPALLALL